MGAERRTSRRWRDVLVVVAVVLAVMLVHAGHCVTETVAQHQSMTMVSQTPSPNSEAATAASSPPSAPSPPCPVDVRTCCISILPSVAPPPLVKPAVLAVAAVVAPEQVPPLEGAWSDREVRPPPPPDLSALCVLRI